MAIYCDKCGARHECAVCPACSGFGLSNLQVAAGMGKSFQPTDELRAKFEAWYSQDFYAGTVPAPTWIEERNCYQMFTDHLAWNAYQAAHASRDAEVEALRKDAERWRSLVAENNKGRHGKFRICWLDPSHEGFITTDGVSRAGKDEEAVVRIFDAAMQNDT